MCSDRRSQLSKDRVSRLGRSANTLPKARSAAASSSVSSVAVLGGRCEMVRRRRLWKEGLWWTLAMKSVNLFVYQCRNLTLEHPVNNSPLEFCFSILLLCEMYVPSPSLEVIVVSIERFEKFQRILPSGKSTFEFVWWFVQLMRDDQRRKPW